MSKSSGVYELGVKEDRLVLKRVSKKKKKVSHIKMKGGNKR